LWWAQLVGAPSIYPVNIGPTIPAEKIEELMNVKGIGEKSFLKIKSRLTVVVPKA